MSNYVVSYVQDNEGVVVIVLENVVIVLENMLIKLSVLSPNTSLLQRNRPECKKQGDALVKI